MNRKSVLNIAVASVGLLSTALSGVASAVVVNIDSLANRIPWDQLVNTSGLNKANYLNQVQLTLNPGTYAFSYVAGAWNPWGQAQPSAACAQTLNCGLGVGWVNAAAFDTGSGTAIMELGTSSRWYTPALALQDAQANGPYIYTFANPTTLRLFIPDSVYDEVGQYWWNTGGVSLNITSVQAPAVPVPATAWLLGSGLLGLIGVARRRIQVG